MTRQEIEIQMNKLVKKAKEEWHEDWTTDMMSYDTEYDEIIVWIGRIDCYKAWFDAKTLAFKGSKL